MCHISHDIYTYSIHLSCRVRVHVTCVMPFNTSCYTAIHMCICDIRIKQVSNEKESPDFLQIASKSSNFYEIELRRGISFRTGNGENFIRKWSKCVRAYFLLNEITDCMSTLNNVVKT